MLHWYVSESHYREGDAKNLQWRVEEFASRIFVSNVEAAALAMMTVVLVRGLTARSEQTASRDCIITDDMCQLMTIVRV